MAFEVYSKFRSNFERAIRSFVRSFIRSFILIFTGIYSVLYKLRTNFFEVWGKLRTNFEQTSNKLRTIFVRSLIEISIKLRMHFCDAKVALHKTNHSQHQFEESCTTLSISLFLSLSLSRFSNVKQVNYTHTPFDP